MCKLLTGMLARATPVKTRAQTFKVRGLEIVLIGLEFQIEFTIFI